MNSHSEILSKSCAGRAADSRREPPCRVCNTPLNQTFADLGVSPLANSFLTADQLHGAERFYPLHAYVCSNCLLVQLEALHTPGDIFSEYAYFSSYSMTWLAHCRDYVQDALRRFRLNGSSQVVEIASNDGCLLQFFARAGIPILGVEPAANVARTAVEHGIPTEIAFFEMKTAERLRDSGFAADLVIANNVLAHVPNIHSFVAGIRKLLKPGGACTLEFPHLLNLIRYGQFDTIYHEHYSYLSLHVVERLFQEHDLRIFDAAQIPTHGGSLRLYACGAEDQSRTVETSVATLRDLERDTGLHDLATYLAFPERITKTKLALWAFFTQLRMEGKTIAGYGAPAKGNTLLNYCGITRDLLPYTVDVNPHKQGLYLPGTRIPIHAPEVLNQTRPDYILILPWNLKEEIVDRLAHARARGARFVLPIPELEVIA